MIQQSHSWAYIQIKPSSEKIHAHKCSLQHYLQKARQESTLSSVQSLSLVQLFATPWTTAHQASLSITNSQSLLKLISIKTVMPSNNFILCRPSLFLPSIFLSIRVFSNESVQMSQFFTSGGQSIGVSATISVLPMNIHS